MEDYISCQICGKNFRQIITAHLKSHNISLIEYKEIFWGNNTVSDYRFKQLSTMKGRKRPEHSKRMSVENNPMFGKERTCEEKSLMSKNRLGKAIGKAGKYERTDEIKHKIRIGVTKYFKSLPKKDLTLFKIYWNDVWRETYKWITILYDSWNGYCYYSKEKLIQDITLHKNRLYHSIDHKTSIIYGFENNINPIEIGKFENLCICSKGINSTKKGKTEEEFILYLKRKGIVYGK